MNTIKLVTFDLDGTIIDDEWAHEKAKTEIAAGLGAVGELDLQEYTGRSNRMFWEHICRKYHLQGEINIEELVDLQFKKVLNFLKETRQTESPGLAATLKYLKENGYTVAVTSGSDDYFVDELLIYLNIYPYFDIKITKNHVRHVKPEPDIYLAAQRIAGIDACFALGVEDSNSGCLALKKAGMISVGYTNQGTNPQSLKNADYIIPEIGHIISILETLQKK